MPKLRIDNREVEVPEGATILDAARTLGIDVPALCFLEGCEPSTSCMCCVVRVNGSEAFVPSCAAPAREGMSVESETDEVRAARRAALELLLGDHAGDCMGPCQSICPAGMDIPRMIRQIAAGRLPEAIATVKDHIALPAVLGRICPAPCEKGCRRGRHDGAVSIMLLKRYVADADQDGFEVGEPYLPPREPETGKKVAIVGAGPAGLAAAFYLLRLGHACDLFDDHDAPGGMLRYAVDKDRLPRDVLDAEIAVIERLGARFQMNALVGEAVSVDELRADFDAVLIAIGQFKNGDAELLDLPTDKDRLRVEPRTLQTPAAGIFAAGDAVRRQRLTVRAVADGRTAAVAIDQLLRGQPVTGPDQPFNTRMGTLEEGEIERFVAGASAAGRVEPARPDGGFTDAEARAEAARCLHCDCRKPDACKLRRYAELYGARPARFRGQRRLFTQHADHPEVIYEPGKCISCGLCVQIARAAAEPLGLTFIGRGFDVRVAAPFDETLAAALQTTAAACAAACPTGALVLKD